MSSERGIEEAIAGLLNDTISAEDLIESAIEITDGRRPPNFPRNAPSLLTKNVRVLVEEWIQSGRGSDGSDDAWARQFPSRIVTALARRTPFDIGQAIDGGLVLKLRGPVSPKQVTTWIEDLAFSYFLRLLDSPRRECLASCMQMGCEKFFVRLRVPNRSSAVQLGTYCKDHREQRKVRSVSEARKQRNHLMLELASQLAKRCPENDCSPGWPDWIAREVNKAIRNAPKRFAGCPTITKNWASHHRAVIQAKALGASPASAESTPNKREENRNGSRKG